jgi:hypothetical protein
MLIEYYILYWRQPPDFVHQPTERLLALPDALHAERFRPYDQCAYPDGYAWITASIAQYILYDAQGKIEGVWEYYVHFWAESHAFTKRETKRAENTEEAREARQRMRAAFEYIPGLPGKFLTVDE